jgi:hypothetical protein
LFILFNILFILFILFIFIMNTFFLKLSSMLILYFFFGGRSYQPSALGRMASSSPLVFASLSLH